jgi:hypothetical protein
MNAYDSQILYPFRSFRLSYFVGINFFIYVIGDRVSFYV